MNYKVIFSSLGYVIFLIGIFMLCPLAVDLYYGVGIKEFVIPVLISVITGSFLILFFKNRSNKEEFYDKEAIIIVVMSWIFAAIFGSIPYLFSSVSPLDALFETMSGFTTTGSTILLNIESYSQGLLFWRNMTQWLGGMGIIVLFFAVLPGISASSLHLIRKEASFMTIEKIRPRIRDTARIFCGIYMLFTILETVLLFFCNLSFYDAICTTFTTVSTGGFHPRAEGIAYYNSPIVEIIVMVFMFLSSMNFALHYRALNGRIKDAIKDEEFRFYLSAVLISIGIITVDLALRINSGDFLTSIRYASFNVISIVTATGFSTIDFSSTAFWTESSMFILLILMLLGGCAGSTSGGIKAGRVYLVFKFISREFRHIIHPNAVIPIKYNGRVVSEDMIHNTFSFVLLYLFLFVLISLLLMMMGYDPATSLSAVATTMENCGPGLGSIGPFENFAFFNPIAKLLLIFSMLVGRLELFIVLILFIPMFWKR